MTGQYPHPWQQVQWQQLQQRREQGALPHAILLMGQAGLGLDYFARLFAQSLICTEVNAQSESCGHCHACLQFSQGVYADYKHVGLLEDKSRILVDQVRELSDFLALTKNSEGYKVVVISPADKMNINAANSLLKNLEEPSGKVIILLVASHLHGLPATIKSRCQMLKFTKPDHAVAMNWLQARGLKNAEQALQLAQGAPCLAVSQADPVHFEQYTVVMDGALGMVRGQQSLSQLRKVWSKCEIERLVSWSLALLRDCIRAVSQVTEANFENHYYLEQLRGVSSLLDLAALFKAHDHLAQLGERLDHPLNADLLLDDVLLTWQALANQH
ncbi:MAG TPA: DNA polymerase III subunit delta' [Gammaproteobacteria bacterium]|nr:DNA polymerase III subunit delta' [Gammaproteobacteria bacterium]